MPGNPTTTGPTTTGEISTDFDLQPTDRLAVGAPAPLFKLADPAGEIWQLGQVHLSGRPAVLLFLRGPVESGSALLSALRDHHGAMGDLEAAVVVISPESAAALGRLKDRQGLPFPVLSDPGDQVARAYGVGRRSVGVPGEASESILLDANQRVVLPLPGPEVATAAEEILAALGALQAARPVQYMTPHPPVLQIPKVLSPEECRSLIHVFHSQGDKWLEPGNFSYDEDDFKMKVLDYGRQDRVDHIIADKAVMARIDARLQSRVIPEIRKVFQYQVTNRDYLHIARYEGPRQGLAVGHRDDSRPEFANRRFALSINLNSGEYEGGELVYREYGEQRYRPESGTALVFSSTLLHEVLETTDGARYTLLSNFSGKT
jgi:peroxiredoxin